MGTTYTKTKLKTIKEQAKKANKQDQNLERVSGRRPRLSPSNLAVAPLSPHTNLEGSESRSL